MPSVGAGFKPALLRLSTSLDCQPIISQTPYRALDSPGRPPISEDFQRYIF